MRDRPALVLGAITAAVHLAVAGRYDIFRDELYFIACGRQPALGYADQPPLVPLAAAAGYALGGQTWLVRLPAVAAAAALVWVTIAFVRVLGGGNGAAWLAGAGVAFGGMFMGLTATLNTTTFEPLAWTLVAYALARAVVLDDLRALWWGGAAAGVAMQAKYALPLWLAALALGLALGPQRRLLARRELWGGIALAAAVAAPSLLWQAAHGWPFVELMHNAAEKDVAVAPAAFVAGQLMAFNPLFAPLWVGGIIAPFVMRSLAPVRFVAIAYAFTALVVLATHGKDYYLAPACAALFAPGAVAAERWLRSARARAAYLTAALALALIGAPASLPIVDPPALGAYLQRLHLAPRPQEKTDAGALIPPTFADMLGWHDFVDQVGSAWLRVPAADRSRTAVLVDNYGEAGALDLYGARYGLPPALSGHNQYYYWGLRGQHPLHVLRVQRHPEQLRPYCDRTTVLGSTFSRFARGFENGKAIAFCRGLRRPLSRVWPELKLII